MVVRGYALPNDYFFKGNIDLRECYDCDIEKENNIKALLRKIKHNDFETIMMVPDEDDSRVCSNTEQVAIARHSWSNKDPNIAASVTTSQLNEQMHRICSGHNLNLKSDTDLKSNIEPVLEGPVEFNFTTAHCVKDINTLLDNVLKKYFSPGDKLQKEDYNDLDDDDPLIQKGIDEVFYSHNTFNSSNELTSESSNHRSSESNESTQENHIFAATEKLINFINKKKREYSTDH